MILNKTVLRVIFDDMNRLGLVTEETFSGYNVKIMDKKNGYINTLIHKNKLNKANIVSNAVKTIDEFKDEFKINTNNLNEIIELAQLNKVFLSNLN